MSPAVRFEAEADSTKLSFERLLTTEHALTPWRIIALVFQGFQGCGVRTSRSGGESMSLETDIYGGPALLKNCETKIHTHFVYSSSHVRTDDETNTFQLCLYQDDLKMFIFACFWIPA